MTSEVYDTLEGRVEVNRLISIFQDRASQLEIRESDISYLESQIKESKILAKLGSDMTPEQKEQYKLISLVKRTVAENLKKEFLKGYISKRKPAKQNVEEKCEQREDEESEDLDSEIEATKKSVRYHIIEKGLDESDNPYRIIICPGSESAKIKKPSFIADWQCETPVENSELCKKCKYALK